MWEELVFTPEHDQAKQTMENIIQIIEKRERNRERRKQEVIGDRRYYLVRFQTHTLKSRVHRNKEMEDHHRQKYMAVIGRMRTILMMMGLILLVIMYSPQSINHQGIIQEIGEVVRDPSLMFPRI